MELQGIENHSRFGLLTGSDAATRCSMASHSLDLQISGFCLRCIDTFELEEALYKGTASLVYVAVDKISTKTVVLKLYRKSKLSTLNRFQVEREILLHSQLRHRHIIDLVI